MQTQLKLYNKIQCKSTIVPTLRFLTEQTQNKSLEKQQSLSEVFSMEQKQAENESLKWNIKKNRSCKSMATKNENWNAVTFLQQLKRFDSVLEDDKTTLEITQVVPSTSEKSSQQVDRTEVP